MLQRRLHAPLFATLPFRLRQLPGVAMAAVWLALLCLVSWSLPASAERLPVVFVVDAALDQREFDLTGEILLETSSQLPDDTVFSLIIYDNVVQAMMPLAALDKTRLSAIMQTLENTNPTPDSNLAAGFERALDIFKDTQAGHVVFFTSGQISALNDEQRKQYLEWYEDILLPDSALKALAITIVSAADIQTHPILKVSASYQHIEFLPMDSSGKTSSVLTAKLMDITVLAENDTTTAGSVDVDQGNTQTDKTDNKDQIGPDITVTGAPPETQVEKPSWQEKWLANRNLQSLAIVAVVLLLLSGLLIRLRRKRKTRDSTEQRNDTTTKSAYLPLDVTPSGRLTRQNNIAEEEPDLPIADEEARWTDKWTGHADIPEMPSSPAQASEGDQLASEDTTRIAVNKPLPDAADSRSAEQDETVRNKIEDDDSTRIRK